jgi:hypothetical protein
MCLTQHHEVGARNGSFESTVDIRYTVKKQSRTGSLGVCRLCSERGGDVRQNCADVKNKWFDL